MSYYSSFQYIKYDNIFIESRGVIILVFPIFRPKNVLHYLRHNFLLPRSIFKFKTSFELYTPRPFSQSSVIWWKTIGKWFNHRVKTSEFSEIPPGDPWWLCSSFPHPSTQQFILIFLLIFMKSEKMAPPRRLFPLITMLNLSTTMGQQMSIINFFV